MSARSKPKFNAPLGQLPVLQYCSPEQLSIDPDYQRSLDASASQALIRKIAMRWDWGLCQPLFVARRVDGQLFVVDGQHRLAAAQLRGDIWQLPCVVIAFATAAEEAASFVALNQQRRPLADLELFKAAVTAGDAEACQIVSLIEDAGLSLATSTNNAQMRPGAIGNVGGVRRALRVHGDAVVATALKLLAAAWPGETLRYAGSLFPGLVALVVDYQDDKNPDAVVAAIAPFIGKTAQGRWFQLVMDALAGNPLLNRKVAIESIMRTAWIRRNEPAPTFGRATQVPRSDTATNLKPAETAWCDQCDQKRSGAQAAACASHFCSLKRKAA